MNTLSHEQTLAFDAVREGKNVFLTGGGGTGKTFLINAIYRDMPRLRVRETGLGVKVCVTALTGCAAILLGPHAKTVHSWAGIGLGKDTVENHVSMIRKNGRAKKNWAYTDILVIDEISMMPPDLFEKLDKIGRIMRRCPHTPFGGIQLALCGDFLQLPPVIKGGDLKFCFESPLWNDTVEFEIELTEIHRQTDDTFRTVLQEARMGSLSKESIAILDSRVGLNWKKNRIRPTLLFPRRAEVDAINEANLKALVGEKKCFKAGFVLSPDAPPTFNLRDEDFLQRVLRYDKNSMYDAELDLVVGAQVMLLTNVDFTRSLVNGSRGVIVEFIGDSTHYPVVEFMTGERVTVAPAQWEIDDYKGVFRTQIPLTLAYALTDHKAQGLTLDCALIDIGANIFEYGQAYVALSRVRSLEGLYIHAFEPGAILAHPRVLSFYEEMRKRSALGVTCSITTSDPAIIEDEEDPSHIVNMPKPSSQQIVVTKLDAQNNWLYSTAPEEWRPVLARKSSSLQALCERLEGKVFLPPREDVWNALRLIGPDKVRVVLLGQDPYPTPGHAHGLAFSVKEGVTVAPSLRNILKELESDMGVKRLGGCLEDWAVQGILLLNTVLTVEPGKSQSHAKIGWEEITDTILTSLRGRKIVFVLWGKVAQMKKKLLDGETVWESAHPSPLSAHNGFFGSKPFSAINRLMGENGLGDPIRWE